MDVGIREVPQQNPESFQPPPLLYLPVIINGTQLGAVVDTAAQASFIMLSAARRAGMQRLVDSRFAGNTSGNSTTNGGIVGRIHICHMVIGTTPVRCSLVVSESGPKDRARNLPDVVIGADVLLNAYSILDLKRKWLVIGHDKAALHLDVM
jgi:Aspartyl protease